MLELNERLLNIESLVTKITNNISRSANDDELDVVVKQIYEQIDDLKSRINILNSQNESVKQVIKKRRK